MKYLVFYFNYQGVNENLEVIQNYVQIRLN